MVLARYVTPTNNAMNRSREAGRLWNGKSLVAARLSRTLANMQPHEPWSSWIDTNRHQLKRIGLPPEVSLSKLHWEDFLENGDLHYHVKDSTGFSFNDLHPKAADALRRFLEDAYGEVIPTPPLLGWLRVRKQEGFAT